MKFQPLATPVHPQIGPFLAVCGLPLSAGAMKVLADFSRSESPYVFPAPTNDGNPRLAAGVAYGFGRR
jgi:hypothetical protein